jgi:maleylpyruvate isomerase
VPDEINEPDLAQVARDIEAMVASHRALADHLAGLDGVDPSAPSRLPGWSVGHVLTHIARNADGALRQLDGLQQYWMAATSRNADIELGAPRSWNELVDDVVTTSVAVEARMREVTDWTGSTESIAGRRPKAMLPETRRREVEIHRADLGLGYGFADMPRDFVRTDIGRMAMAWSARQPMGMTTLPDAVLALPEPDRLAWLWGRLTVPGVDPSGF